MWAKVRIKVNRRQCHISWIELDFEASQQDKTSTHGGQVGRSTLANAVSDETEARGSKAIGKSLHEPCGA